MKYDFDSYGLYQTGKIIRHCVRVNYTGYYDWGDLVNYVESFVFIVDAHLVIEISALGDKIFFAPMQLIKSKKYINAFEEALKELNISYRLEGPYDKKLPAQDFPR